MGISKRFETISGSRVAFLETTGEFPVLLVHGFFTSSYLWSALCERHGRSFRFLAPDLVGFGDTHTPIQMDSGFERQTDFLCQFLLNRVGLRPVRVVAHAHGVIPAIMLAMQKPGLVRELVLVSPVFEGTFPGRLARPFFWAANSRLSWELFFHSGMARAHVEHTLRRAAGSDDSVPESLLEEFWRPFANSQTARQRLRRVFLDCDAKLLATFSRHLNHVTCPVKVIVGRQDLLCAPEDAERLGHRFFGGSIQVVDDTGHFLPLARPGLLAFD